jgi:spore maturation protein CgeB
MKLVVFGLSVSSAWGNGHATLWRGLIWALARRGHSVTFYERDVPYYASHRDCFDLPNGELRLYATWEDVRHEAARALRDADAAMVTSYCPDGIAATELVLDSKVGVKAFYDLDTPITLEKIRGGEPVSYLGTQGLRDFDVVLSYTGGAALAGLMSELGARRVLPLYGSVDPALHAPTLPDPRYRADLSYLGTYAKERQTALDALFLEPARRSPERKFVLGGSQYPGDFPWTPNLYFVRHVPPAEHGAFYCSARLNLNVTRAPMAAMGYCPSGRLFEAAACGAALVTDTWRGLRAFYEPGSEILVAESSEDVIAALDTSDADLQRIGRRARERTLAEHTIDHRARELLSILDTRTEAQPSRGQRITADMEA